MEPLNIPAILNRSGVVSVEGAGDQVGWKGVAAVLSVVPESGKAGSRFQSGHGAPSWIEHEFIHHSTCRAGAALPGIVPYHVAGGRIAVAAKCEV